MESRTILEYLGEKFDTSLLPRGERRWDVLPWVYWQAANVGPAFGKKLSYTPYIADVDEEQTIHGFAATKGARSTLRIFPM